MKDKRNKDWRDRKLWLVRYITIYIYKIYIYSLHIYIIGCAVYIIMRLRTKHMRKKINFARPYLCWQWYQKLVYFSPMRPTQECAKKKKKLYFELNCEHQRRKNLREIHFRNIVIQAYLRETPSSVKSVIKLSDLNPSCASICRSHPRKIG